MKYLFNVSIKNSDIYLPTFLSWINEMRENYLTLNPKDTFHILLCELAIMSKIRSHIGDQPWIKHIVTGDQSLSKARNMAIDYSKDYDKLIIWDSNVLIHPKHFQTFIRRLSTKNMIVPINGLAISENNKGINPWNWKAFFGSKIETIKSTPIGNLIAGDVKLFIETKGFDERLGAGYEYKAFKLVLDCLNIKFDKIDYPGLLLKYQEETLESSDIYEDIFEKDYSNHESIRSRLNHNENYATIHKL